ncbi:MAG: hypothetical protein KDE27_03175, partial [Planctomycetes bacterium]|nr:hypothetical protein [Planctomycetota bacterium]
MRRFLTSARAMLPRLFPFLLPLGLVAQEQACLPYDKSVNPASAAVELTVTEPTGITLETIRLTGDINVRWQFDIVAGNQATLTGAESLGAPTPINHVFDIDDCRLPPGDYVLLLRRTAGSSYFVSGNWRGGGTGNGLSAYARTMWSNTNFEGPGAPAGVGPCLRYSLGALPCDLALDSRSLAGDALSGGIEVTTATGTTIVTGATTQQWPAGTAVTLTAPLEVSGAVFANWEVDGVDLAPGEQRLDLTLFRDRQVVAEYRTLHLLTVQATQDGTSIQSAVSASPADRNGLTGGTATFALDYEWGTAVTLTAPELFANRGMFRRWLVDDVAQPLWANELTVTIDDDRTVVAEYTGVECFEWDMGPGLGMTDNSLSVGHALGFDFPLPGGGTTDTIDIDSNG